MSKEHGLTTADIQKLAQAAGVNNPVMSVRVVGDRIELHLLGGAVTTVPSSSDQTNTITQAPKATTVTQSTQDLLESMTVKQLKELATQLGLAGYSKAKKQDLIDTLLSSFTEDQLALGVREDSRD